VSCSAALIDIITSTFPTIRNDACPRHLWTLAPRFSFCVTLSSDIGFPVDRRLTCHRMYTQTQLAARERGSEMFAVLFRMVAKWRAIQNKTTNSYVIEIAI